MSPALMKSQTKPLICFLRWGVVTPIGMSFIDIDEILQNLINSQLYPTRRQKLIYTKGIIFRKDLSSFRTHGEILLSIASYSSQNQR